MMRCALSAKQLEETFQAGLAATMWHSFHRTDDQALSSYESACDRRGEAVWAAETLLERIRR